MERHEKIKNLCERILNYYYINADTEYQLPDNQRIDVVGYFNNKNSPDIGIEIELSSSLQHDAAKLATTGSLKLRIIVTEHPDTLLLDKSINGIYIVKPPDEDMAFESKIREYTGENKKNWFNQFQKDVQNSISISNNPLNEFVKEIRDQGLNIDLSKDLIFRAALGGIHLGEYKQGKISTMYYGSKPSKELLYLKATGFIWEDRLGRNYEQGRQSIYRLSSGDDIIKLCNEIIEERIDEKKDLLYNIVDKYSESPLFISLIGTKGKFLLAETYESDISYDGYSPVSDLSALIGGFMEYSNWVYIRDFLEEFNIKPEINYILNIVANSPIFENAFTKPIYRDIVDAKLGNLTEAYTTKGNYIGNDYIVPLRLLLRKLNFKTRFEPEQLEKLRSYSEWYIIRGHNPNVPETLYKSFEDIGSSILNAEKLINELAENGITSKPLKQGNNIAIYDKKRFNDFCEAKMEKILEDIIDEE